MPILQPIIVFLFQAQQRMCVNKEEITALDIYQRILRNENYMIPLVTMNVIPVKFHVPLVGEYVYLTKGYQFNLSMLLFWNITSIKQMNSSDHRRFSDPRKETIANLRRWILIIGVLNLVFMPLVFLYQVLYAFYHNVERLKNEPGSLGGRCWSQYGRHCLRHYNEADHELNNRLNRAFRYSNTYLNSFSSPLLATVADLVSFVAKAIFAIFIVLGIIDDDFLRVENTLRVLAVCVGVITCTKSLLPDENLVFIPDQLMERILVHVHYLPESWHGCYHTKKVRSEFSMLFQYKFVQIVEELLSPIITPFILLFWLRPKSAELVDFFYTYTVEVEGIGNVCSFAQMDIGKHGTPRWHNLNKTKDVSGNAHQNAEVCNDDGRTEMSLLHFTFTNPEYQPSKEGTKFIGDLKARIAEKGNLPTVGEQSLVFSGASVSLNPGANANQWGQQSVMGYPEHSMYVVRGCNGSVAKSDGPLTNSVSESLRYRGPSNDQTSNMANSVRSTTSDANNLLPSPDPNESEYQTQGALDMGRSCLYLREFIQRNRTQHEFYDYDAAPESSNNPRSYRRSPSPPAVRPSHDALLSQMISPEDSISGPSRPKNYEDEVPSYEDEVRVEGTHPLFKYNAGSSYRGEEDQVSYGSSPPINSPTLDSPPFGSPFRFENPPAPSDETPLLPSRNQR